MGTVYVDVGGSRVASHDGVDQSGADNASVTGWYRDSDIMFCHTIYTSKGPLTRQFKLQYRNVTDAGAWTDIGNGSGEIRYDNVTSVIPNDDYTITSGFRICSIVSGYTWQNGVANLGNNLILNSGGYTINDEYYTEFQWALGVAYTSLNKQYEFRLYDVTMSYAYAAFGAKLTINSSDIESTGSRLWGESTLGSPTYRYDWTSWLNKGTWTAVTPVNGSYGQLNGADIVSPIFRFGGAKFVKVIENLYGLLGSGNIKIYVRAYPSIFPYNTSDSVVSWTLLTKRTDNPFGMFGTNNGYYKYAQIRVTEATSTGLSSGTFLHCWGIEFNEDGGTIMIRERDKTAWGAGYLSLGIVPTGSIYNISFRSLNSPIGKSWSHAFVAPGNSGWLDTNGYAWAGGNNTYGQLGQNDFVSYSAGLMSVAGGHSFKKILVGTSCVSALKADGSIWNWGHANCLGNGNDARDVHASSPISAIGNHSFIEMAKSGWMTWGLKANGELWAWGDTYRYDAYGSGVSYPISGYISYQTSPVIISGNLNVSRILCGGGGLILCDCIFGSSGSWYMIGGWSPSELVGPLRVASPDYLWDHSLTRRYTTIANNTYLTFTGLDSEGVLWSWGQDVQGSTGRLNYMNSAIRLSGLAGKKQTSFHSPVYGGATWKAIYGGGGGRCAHFMAVSSLDQVYGWGCGAGFRLGNGGNVVCRYPIIVVGGSPWA